MAKRHRIEKALKIPGSQKSREFQGFGVLCYFNLGWLIS
jgi:hypothetical protein